MRGAHAVRASSFTTWSVDRAGSRKPRRSRRLLCSGSEPRLVARRQRRWRRPSASPCRPSTPPCSGSRSRGAGALRRLREALRDRRREEGLVRDASQPREQGVLPDLRQGGVARCLPDREEAALPLLPRQPLALRRLPGLQLPLPRLSELGHRPRPRPRQPPHTRDREAPRDGVPRTPAIGDPGA